MSDENLPDEGDGIKNLRKQYDAMKKQNDELLSELGTFRAERRASQVAEVLKAKGVPAEAASLYSGEDTSEAAVVKWVEQHASVFGGVKQEADQADVPDANAEAARRVAGNSFGAVEGSSVPTAGAPILGDPDEMERFMRTAPIEELQKRGLFPANGTLFNP